MRPPRTSKHGRNANAFLIDLARQRHGAGTHSSDVGVMRAVRDIERRLAIAFQKDAGDRGDIGKVRAAAERIVQNRDIAGAEIEGLRGVLYRERHRAQMHGHVIAHGHRFAAGVVNGARIVAAFLDIRRE